MYDGVVVIDKPAGLTSHDVVYRLRRILQTKKIGHTGTLDPFATGVLVMLVGKATRLARFLDGDEKEYEAVLRFGYETDTGDHSGNVSENGKLSRPGDELDAQELQSILKEFRGEIEQVPPMYSAKKVAGKKLYELARAGIEVERDPVKVQIPELEYLGPAESPEGQNKNEFRLRVVCSAGTYIRTLAEDIGRKLGIGCHLSDLRRTAAGMFRIENAHTIDELENWAGAGKANDHLVPMNTAVGHLPEIQLNEEDKERVKKGMRLGCENALLSDGQPVRLTYRGDLLAAIGYYDSKEKLVKPRIVFL